MRHLDLFSGIGGFSLAAEWVWGEDHEIVAFVEQDKYCKERLGGLWPDVPIIDDIRGFNGKVYAGTIDLLTGGFPCQPFSVAGKQRGKEDDRAIWDEMFRVIQEAKSTWVIGENVTGIINMELDNCIADLESEGYEVQTFIIPACGVDARHQRYRAWIVAHSGHDARVDVEISGNNGQGSVGPSEGQNGTIEPEGPGGCKGRAEDVADAKGTKCNGTINPRSGRKGFADGSDDKGTTLADSNTRLRSGAQEEICTGRCSIGFSCEVVADSDKQHGNNGGSGAGKTSQLEEAGIFEGEQWPAEPGVGRVANGIPNRVDRLKGLGNAIVPQVVRPIMEAIKEVEFNYE